MYSQVRGGEVWKKWTRVAAQFNHLLCGNSQAGFPRIHEFATVSPYTDEQIIPRNVTRPRRFCRVATQLRTVCVSTRKRGNYALTVQYYRRQTYHALLRGRRVVGGSPSAQPTCTFVYIYIYMREDGEVCPSIRKERRFYEFFIGIYSSH